MTLPMTGAGPSAVSAGGWWTVPGKTCTAAYQPKGAATYAASKINLANPGTYDAADGAAYPTWAAATGWKFNGTTQYLNSGVLALGASQDASMLVQFVSAQNAEHYLCGSSAGVGAFAIAPRHTLDVVVYYNGSFLSVAPRLLTGNLAIAGNKGYRNGAADAGTISAGNAGTLAIWIGGLNLNGVLQYKTAAYVTAWAIYYTTLTAAEVAIVAAAMAAL